MKVGFVSTATNWGGGENLLAQLIRGLRQAGIEVALASPERSAMRQWAIKCAVETEPLPGRGRSPQALWRLRRWRVASRLNLAVLNDPHAITYAGVALAGAGVPRIGVRHTVFPVRSAWKHCRLLERVVAVSSAARDECLTAGVPDSQVEVIHGGVEPATPDAESRERASRLMRGEPGTRNLLAVGSLLPVKGFDTLIRALAVSESGWRLWIAGEGPERERLEALARSLGIEDRVHLIGFRTDVAALLAAADAFASASHQEGLSLVVIEAMLAGTPIAATPVGGVRDVLGTNERGQSEFAATFSPGEPSAASAAIREALARDSLARQRAETARQRALSAFSCERMTRAYVDLFERLLAEREVRRSA